MCSRLLESETTTYFFLIAQVTNTLLCMSGRRQVFFLSGLLLGQIQFGLTLFIPVSLQWISKTFLFVLIYFLIRKLWLSTDFGT